MATRTVEAHLQHIFQKLGINNRGALMAIVALDDEGES
jgi:DNA-binding CsgD family transcriptional regulator